MQISRRTLLRASAGSLLAAAPGLKVAMAATSAPAKDILIVLFLRGGSDGLQMVAPAGDANYIANRPTIGIKASGTNAGLGLGTLDGTDFFLNPQAPELKALYDSKKLAIVHATGLPTGSRSHFECMDRMERGASDGELGVTNGWLTRHLNTVQTARPVLGTVSSGTSVPASLLGCPEAIAVPNAQSFNLVGGSLVTDYLRYSNAGDTLFQKVALATVDAVESVQDALLTMGADDTSTFGYTGGALSSSLRSLAKLIKMDVGVDVAAVDMGGWDHHDNMPNEYTARTQELSRSLNAFWTDVAAYRSRITVVTMTEFGRRFRENSSGGTDHGSASVMMVLGGNVNGGKIYGDWPGLASNELDTGDMKVTTDYRRVLGEILVKRQGQTNLGAIFPTVAYDPLGIVAG